MSKKTKEKQTEWAASCCFLKKKMIMTKFLFVPHTYRQSKCENDRNKKQNPFAFILYTVVMAFV